MAGPQGRFLRNPDLRAYLYFENDGVCPHCGEDLPDNWHADHIVPWSVSQRTNLFEMQALCPKCNLRKEVKMSDRHDFNIDETAFRTYQLQAYNKLVEKVREGAKGVSLVLPPRVGKTDVMRIGGLRLIRDKWASAALILVPDRILLHQAFDPGKAQESFDRYGVVDYSPAIYPMTGPFRPYAIRNVDLVGMTIQMATNRLSPISEWVRHMTRIHGVPPVVFFDECHTVSVSSVWGKTLAALQEEGCIVVMVTATPFRTDRQQIPNFHVYPLGDSWDSKYYRPVGNGLMGEFEETRQWLQMQPDHLTEFRTVWDEADPPILCKIYHRKFDILLTERLEATDDPVGAMKLSELDESDEDGVRQVLRTELRKGHIIERSVRIFIDEMVERRMAEGTSATQGIIFVGSNNQELDTWENQHAQDVLSAVRRLSNGRLNAAIATSDDEDAIRTIDSFVGGDHDVIIVKQMAGRGLDVPSLKVELDLSNIRTANAFIQRITRPCTMWKYGPEPTDLAQYCTYISPEDYLSTELFDDLIKEQGGEYLVMERGDETLLRTFEPEHNPPPPHTSLEAEDIMPPTILQDSDDNKASGDMVDFTDYVFGQDPDLYNAITKPRFAQTVENALRKGLVPKLEDVREPAPDTAGTTHRNLEAELSALQKDITELAKKIGNVIFAEKHGRYVPGSEENRRNFQRVMTHDVWGHHYRRIGKRNGTQFETLIQTLTPEEMNWMKANMEQHWKAIGPRPEGEQGRFDNA